MKKLTETDQPLTNTDTYCHCLTTCWHVLSLTDTLWPLAVIYRHLLTFADTYTYWLSLSTYYHLLTLTDTLWPLTDFTDTYWHLLTLANTHWHVLTRTDTYWHILTLKDTYSLIITLRTKSWVLILWTWANDHTSSYLLKSQTCKRSNTSSA